MKEALWWLRSSEEGDRRQSGNGRSSPGASLLPPLARLPQGNALDMLCDVNTGIAWVLRNAAAFGGDGESFHLVGQSAGGQLGALALMMQARGTCWQGAEGGWTLQARRAAANAAHARDMQAPVSGDMQAPVSGDMQAPVSPWCAVSSSSSAPGALLPQVHQVQVQQPQVGAFPAWDPALIRGFVGVR
mgnify:CR=1 FL=1